MIATPGSDGRVNAKRASGTITYPGYKESTTNGVIGGKKLPVLANPAGAAQILSD